MINQALIPVIQAKHLPILESMKKKNETFCFKKECLKEKELTNVSHCFFSLPIHEYMHIINSFM